MDMTGSMPSAAWFEIRDSAGQLLASIRAEITGGTISASLPVFPPGQRGSIQLCTEARDGEIWREEAEIKDLPTQPAIQFIQMS
jgi:hypothetical protein